jgi:hypothetical protein
MNETRTDFGGVICGTKNQFWSAVVARANVGHVRFVFNQNLCTSKIAQFQNPGCWIEQQILWFDVPMTDPLRMNVCQRSEELVDVELDLQNRHRGFHLVEIAGRSVDCLRDVFEHEVEVHFVFLCEKHCQHHKSRITSRSAHVLPVHHLNSRKPLIRQYSGVAQSA